METYALIVMSVLMPILTIAAFVVGYNVNAPVKIQKKHKKHVKTEAEELLDKIDALTVEDF